mmetsp:Transcript_29126/g.82106  ORF Transcript_29126/g.82106 Transcript_29126/m.82106 type:complete len:167 (-) Transcript_29126:128-628(-)
MTSSAPWALLALLAVALLAAPRLPFVCGLRADWEPCDDSPTEPYFAWDGVVLTPDPAVMGQSLSITVVGRTMWGEEVEGGTIHMRITYDYVPVVTGVTRDLCSLTDCPIPPHQKLTLRYLQDMPSYMFSGSYTATAHLTGVGSQAGIVLSCLTVTFDVAAAALPVD